MAQKETALAPNSPTSPIQNHFTKKQLAAHLGKSERTLDRWNELGLGPRRIQIGTLVLYSQHSISEWLKEHESGRARRRGR